MSCFATISEDQFKKLIEDKDSKSTKQATKVAVSVFRSYLKEKHLEDDFENFPSEQLDDILSKFYLEMRKCCGGVYKTSSFKAIRHGLNRFLPNVDIVNDAKNFPKSTESFKAMSAEIKRQGGGGIDHHPPIESDLKKLYNYLDVSNPVMLQKKVFIDILIHFGRRGRESLRNLTVSDFVLTTDAEGSRYLYLKKDEATKNHRNDPNTATASMHEVPGQDEKCPVNSFLRYHRMLPIGCVTLWPKPLTKPSKDGQVFSKSSLGHNKLGSLMKELSVEAQLSKVYTNHSLRASSVHLLDSANVPTRHIMAVTGHKAESSLKTYTGYTDQNTKKLMSHTISRGLGLNPVKENTPPVDNIPIGAYLEDFSKSEQSDIGQLKLDYEFDAFDEDFNTILAGLPESVTSSSGSTLNIPCSIQEPTLPTIASHNIPATSMSYQQPVFPFMPMPQMNTMYNQYAQYNCPLPLQPHISGHANVTINYNFYNNK